MLLGVVVAVASVLAGAVLALVGQDRRPAFQPIQTFAVVAALVVVLGHLLPAALTGLGPIALVPFGAALAFPILLERLGPHAARARHAHAHVDSARAHAQTHDPAGAGGHAGHSATEHTGHEHHGHEHHGHEHHGHEHHRDAQAAATDRAPRPRGRRLDLLLEAIGLELGYFGLVVHQIGDGLALGTFSGSSLPWGASLAGHGGHEAHFDILLAVGLHTIPVVALIVLAYRRRGSLARALVRAGGLALATLLGIAFTGLLAESQIDRLEPWVSAVVGGLLLHIVGHDWEPSPTRTTLSRLADVGAIGLALGMLFLGGHTHDAHGHPPADLRAHLGRSFLDLLVATSPALLVGLAVGALVHALGSLRRARASEPMLPSPTNGAAVDTTAMAAASADATRPVTPWRAAFAATIAGAKLPACACSVVPHARSLHGRGAPPATLVAFLLSAPVLGAETLTLSIAFLGGPFSALRLALALALALVAGRLFASLHPGLSHPTAPSLLDEHDAHHRSLWASFLDHFDALLKHIGPWMFVGWIAAAYVEVVVPPGALEPLALSGLGVVLAALVAVPSYLCAAATVPVAAVLVTKGLSPGAALTLLVLGPALNLAALRLMRAAYGPRATVVGVSLLTFLVIATGWLVNATGLAVGGATPAWLGASTHPTDVARWIGWAAFAWLSFFVLRAVYRIGLRAWLASLQQGFGHQHHHAHASPSDTEATSLATPHSSRDSRHEHAHGHG